MSQTLLHPNGDSVMWSVTNVSQLSMFPLRFGDSALSPILPSEPHSLPCFHPGGVWWIPSAVLCPHQRLPPLLQFGQPHLLSQHHQEVGPRDPGPQPVLPHRSGGDPVGPLTGREHPHQPGPLQRQARAELPGPEHRREDQGGRLHRVFLPHAKELEGGLWCSHLCRH